MAKHKQTKPDLEAHLADHIAFLKSSAAAFDGGFDAEAKRLAVSLRVLLHDTDSSHSLLGQLGMLDAPFYATAIPVDPRNISTHAGLVMIAARGQGTRYEALLDGAPYLKRKPFADWWNEVVIVDDRKQRITRRDLVLAVANQDGGAHVDPKLTETYARLSRENSLGWVYHDASGDTAISMVERSSVRQIAHEVLRTLEPNYRAKNEKTAEMFFGGAMAFDSVPEEWMWRKTTGRNERCPCGSGKKFKKCHGSPTAI